MAQAPLTQRIKKSYSSLSPGQKKVAEFIVQHMDEGALLTAFQIGRKVGVSETTVIRLAYALGFSGYSQLQECVRKEWLYHNQSTVEDGLPVENDQMDEGNLFTRVVEKEKQILDQLLLQINKEEIWAAVDKLIQADRVYIGGFGSSYAAAYWFYYSLKQMRANVFLSNSTGYLPEDICDLSQDSVLFIFSYPRYRKETINLVSAANLQNACIISVTNHQLSPVGQMSTITLTTEEKMESGHHSIASVVSLLEIIIAGIQFRDHERIGHRQQKLEKLYTNQGLFIE